MQRFFVSDIHLNENEPTITVGFLLFLSSLPNQSELYILGDLFDYWVGDDIDSELTQTVSLALAKLSERDIKTFLIVGNRDFLIGDSFAQKSKIQRLPDIHIINDNHDFNIVILHGDLLCIDDISYQQYRKKVHNRIIQRLFLMLPKWIRLKIAKKLRLKSQSYNQVKSEIIMDVNESEVQRIFNQSDAMIMIHGHTHLKQKHNYPNSNHIRIVLGAWHDGANYVIQNLSGEFELRAFS